MKKQKDEFTQHLRPCYTWKDIVLPGNILQQLHKIAARAAYRYRMKESPRNLRSRGQGISALFAGLSGTGKTMAAEILSNHLKTDLYRIDLAGVVSKYIGETEKNLHKIFQAAEQAGAILYFDDADALFGKRTDVKDSHDRYANIEVNYLLQRIEDYRGLTILATKHKISLDRSFLGRLRFLIYFPSPNAQSRRHIWRKVLPSQIKLSRVDLDALARLKITGGAIRNIAVKAAHEAASEEALLSIGHIMQAARREYERLNSNPNHSRKE